MPRWTPKRARRLRRRSDGTFAEWTGGAELHELPEKEQNYHGIATHLGHQFRKQTGRRAKVGDIHRTKNKDGSYSGHAVWYVKTRHGWRKARTGTRKPTAAEIRAVMERSREGQRDTTRRK